MFGFRSLNSGEDLYLLNSESQSSALEGNKLPVTGLHSVMLSLPSLVFKHHKRHQGSIKIIPRFCQSRETSKDDDTKHAGGAPQKPIRNRLLASLGEASSLGFDLGLPID